MDGSPQPRVVTANGTELTYIEQGEGAPVVFVHGSLGDFRSWSELLAPVAERHRTIMYSRRGHYPNPWPAGYTRCDPAQHAADLASLIEALDVGGAHVFGHSYGGLVSLVLAAQRPDLVRTLILGEPPVVPLLDDSPQGMALVAAFMEGVWEPARGAVQRGEVEAGVRLFLDGVIGEGAFDQFPPEVQVAVMDNGAEMGVELQTPREISFSSLTRADFTRMAVPTLLLTGELSPPLFHRINDELARGLPSVERATIPGVSHELWNPLVLTETLLGFMARH